MVNICGRRGSLGCLRALPSRHCCKCEPHNRRCSSIVGVHDWGTTSLFVLHPTQFVICSLLLSGVNRASPAVSARRKSGAIHASTQGGPLQCCASASVPLPW